MDGNGTNNNNNNIHSHQTNNNLSNGPHHHHARQKRVRTSFKHHQLRCMRSYFNLNHNPGLIYFLLFLDKKSNKKISDAKDLKNLAEKTNLPKRVLQVWFQNARAKYRRSVSRSDTLSASQHSSIPQQAQQQQQSQVNQPSLTSPNLIDIHPTREDTTNSSNLSSPTESIRSKTSSVNFSESETCGSM
jgi:LIM homeobox protein 2/9